jgi:hypothetical protein
VHRSGRLVGSALVAIAAVRSAAAASVHVTYLVECPEFLRANPRLGSGSTVELYATPDCEQPALAERFVVVAAVPADERHPRSRQTSGAPPQPALMLEGDVAVDAPPPELYVRLTGTGVKPLGDVCQRQVRRDVPLAPRCSPDAVPSSGHCVDRYEASLWEIPPARVDLICRIIGGTVTLKDLTAPGVRQLGFPGPPFGHAAVPGYFLAEGAYTSPLYAASLPGVLPSTSVSAYQAWAACGFSGKRLPTSREWTAAAAGTPEHVTDDGAGDCNTGAGTISAGGPVKTGSRSRCVSSAGAFDMVGNVSEWTMEGHARTHYRGGAWDAGDDWGTAFTQPDAPLTQDNAVGFRCVR